MKFVADDGKIFDNYDECKDYERTHSKIIEYANLFHDGITMYDEDGNIFQPSADILNTEEYWNELIENLDDSNVSYFDIELDNDDCKEIADFIYEEYGIPIPSSRGLWRYDWSIDEWVTFSTELKNFLNVWRKGKLLPNLKVTLA